MPAAMCATQSRKAIRIVAVGRVYSLTLDWEATGLFDVKDTVRWTM
jgi:hypothetical protein